MPLASAAVLLLAALFGIAWGPKIARSQTAYSLALAFAAGTLLTLVLVHVLPEAFHMHEQAPMLFVLGFVGMLLLHQHVLRADPCCGHEHAQHAGLPSFLALSLCSFNDGIVMSADHALASPLLWAMAIHEANAGFALWVLLRETAGPGTSWLRRAYLLGFALVAPSTLLLAVSLQETHTWMPLVLAASAGALLYVVAGSLVPRVEHIARGARAPVIATFLTAVLVNIGLQFLHAHEH
jgi:zinc transporter ZupT